MFTATNWGCIINIDDWHSIREFCFDIRIDKGSETVFSVYFNNVTLLIDISKQVSDVLTLYLFKCWTVCYDGVFISRNLFVSTKNSQQMNPVCI